MRECKTAADERAIIQKEAAEIRVAFKEEKVYAPYRHRNLAKLCYMHMMGYPTHWSQMECLKLITEPQFPEKRIGYLALMILMDERQELLMMVTNSIKHDLHSANTHICAVALHALGNICSRGMALDLAPEVDRILRDRSLSPLLRRKAALCAVRMMAKVPDLAESFMSTAPGLLADTNHAVWISSMTLLTEIARHHPPAKGLYRTLIPECVRVLKGIINSVGGTDHHFGPTPDPFLQIKILRFLRILGQGDGNASDRMADILAQVASAADGGSPGGASVLYECVATMVSIESSGSLRVLAVNVLGKFLASSDNNKRYVALKMLALVVNRDGHAVRRHRNTVLECIRDADDVIRRKALDLMVVLTEADAVPDLVRTLLAHARALLRSSAAVTTSTSHSTSTSTSTTRGHLHEDDTNVVLAPSDGSGEDEEPGSDRAFRTQLVRQVCGLVQKYPHSPAWYHQTVCIIFAEAADCISPELLQAFLLTISHVPATQVGTQDVSYDDLSLSLSHP